jgi:hypothetical protein
MTQGDDREDLARPSHVPDVAAITAHDEPPAGGVRA